MFKRKTEKKKVLLEATPKTKTALYQPSLVFFPPSALILYTVEQYFGFSNKQMMDKYRVVQT